MSVPQKPGTVILHRPWKKPEPRGAAVGVPRLRLRQPEWRPRLGDGGVFPFRHVTLVSGVGWDAADLLFGFVAVAAASAAHAVAASSKRRVPSSVAGRA